MTIYKLKNGRNQTWCFSWIYIAHWLRFWRVLFGGLELVGKDKRRLKNENFALWVILSCSWIWKQQVVIRKVYMKSNESERESKRKWFLFIQGQILIWCKSWRISQHMEIIPMWLYGIAVWGIIKRTGYLALWREDLGGTDSSFQILGRSACGEGSIMCCSRGKTVNG